MIQITEEQRKALIKDCEDEIAVIKAYIAVRGDAPQLQSKIQRQEIALAALTAEPVAWIVHSHGGDQLTYDGDYVANVEGMHGARASSLYTTPPVAALRLPDEAAFHAWLKSRGLSAMRREGVYVESATRFAGEAWVACRAEVKRLNATAPEETSE